ncbi:MAG: EamA family transporter, partial [SAR116 cluster bacterium]|nr:EamA family transporter [SAR116 cluster bacterium]
MTRNRAMLLIVTGASFMSFVGLLMRLLETTDGLLIQFYRSITLAGMVGLVACLRRRQSPAAFLRSLDRTDMMMGAALAIAFTSYVYAMLMTSVASTLLLLTLSPFFAAVLGWVWIGEKPHRMTWPAMGAALVGVALMIADGSAYGRTAGNSMALVLSKDGNPDIYLLNLKSRALTRLTRHFAIDTEPTWMPDGKSLLFTSDRGGRPQIYRYDLRTQKIERVTFEGRYHARARVAQDGRNV